MKNIISWLVKKALNGIFTWIFIIVGITGVVYATINWPMSGENPTAPDGEIIGGKLSRLFQTCDSGQVLRGFTSTGTKVCTEKYNENKGEVIIKTTSITAPFMQGIRNWYNVCPAGYYLSFCGATFKGVPGWNIENWTNNSVNTEANLRNPDIIGFHSLNIGIIAPTGLWETQIPWDGTHGSCGYVIYAAGGGMDGGDFTAECIKQ